MIRISKFPGKLIPVVMVAIMTLQFTLMLCNGYNLTENCNAVLYLFSFFNKYFFHKEMNSIFSIKNHFEIEIEIYYST